MASLDPASADRVLGLLHGICKADGISAIVSLHQLEFARRYADRIVALSQGRVVFDGAPRELGKREVLHIYREPSVEADDVPEPDLQLKTGTHA